MTIYDGYANWNAGEYPAILAIGDSWFWYPRNNLLEALARHPKLKDGYQHMVRLGENGARLSEYIAPGKFSRRLRQLLQRDPMQYFAVFAVSGAGNDAVDYRLGLNADCTGLARPEDCISGGGLDALVQGLLLDMNLLLYEVMQAFEVQQRAPVVLVHGYDYCVPDGRGFQVPLASQGPWLSKAMDDCRLAADPALRQGVVKILIDRLGDAFAGYARPESGVYFVDSRGTLDSGPGYRSDWDNELHPTRSGFDRIVERAWTPVLQRAGIANP